MAQHQDLIDLMKHVKSLGLDQNMEQTVAGMVQNAYNLGREAGLRTLDEPFGSGWEDQMKKGYKGKAFEPEK